MASFQPPDDDEIEVIRKRLAALGTERAELEAQFACIVAG